MKTLILPVFASAVLFATAGSSVSQTVSPAAPPVSAQPDAAAATAPIGGKPSVLPPSDEGLLREGLNESAHLKSAPVAVALPVPSKPARSTSVSHYHPRHHRHRAQPVQSQSRLAVSQPRKHRNFVVSFVYWWNGLVIRKLHTKVGTVMLGTVGAKS